MKGLNTPPSQGGIHGFETRTDYQIEFKSPKRAFFFYLKGMNCMEYFYKYNSPIGEIWLKSDGTWLTEISLKENSKLMTNDKLEIFEKTTKWLDDYFEGIEPKEKLRLKPKGTPFQKEIWHLLLEIPYGRVTTYGALAEKMAKKRNKEKMSAQAIGNAVHNNPIPIIIPCHRVVGKNKNLVGYGLGMNLKIKLLKTEKTNLEGYYFYENKQKISIEK